MTNGVYDARTSSYAEIASTLRSSNLGAARVPLPITYVRGADAWALTKCRIVSQRSVNLSEPRTSVSGSGDRNYAEIASMLRNSSLGMAWQTLPRNYWLPLPLTYVRGSDAWTLAQCRIVSQKSVNLSEPRTSVSGSGDRNYAETASTLTSSSLGTAWQTLPRNYWLPLPLTYVRGSDATTLFDSRTRNLAER
jgi:hypothetical protein